MNRRQVIFTGLSSLVSGIIPVFAQTTNSQEVVILGELPPLPPDLAGKSSQPPAAYVETDLVGTQPPSQQEINVARDLMIQAPFGVSPIEVAQYFLAVGAGAYGKEVSPFVREWPERANPMIFHFFSSTLTKPEGDTTAWCAAFINWCLLRARASTPDEIGKSPGYFSIGGKPFSDENLKKHSTTSASSGSFRCWSEVSSPKHGDIAVFKNPGTGPLTGECRGKGHVSFFLSVPREGWVRVLGGNQSDPGSGGAINIAQYRTGSGSRFMKYVSPK